MPKTTCPLVINGVICGRPHYARGWCHMHYQRWKRTGDPLGVRPVFESHLHRILSYCDRNGPIPTHRPELGPCWLWLKPLDKDGYAKTKVDGRMTFVHRAVYTLMVGEIPEGLTLDHLCHSPDHCTPGRSCPHRRCCNPDHLEPVPMVVNAMRGGNITVANARKTHCPRGHEYTLENTYVLNGGRHCIECGRIRSREHQRRKRALAIVNQEEG